ncbi:DNA/pantothenate metabolism flavoprotein [Schizophyllum fasciatum]
MSTSAGPSSQRERPSSSSQFSSSFQPTTFSADSYFATQPAPPTLSRDVEGVRAFIERCRKRGQRVVLITSGGTTVPLELNVVRFLDNFSAGTRGATSAEYFLKAGYAVIFMHRQFSLQPFSRHYSHSTNPFLDLLEIHCDPRDPAKEQITVAPQRREELLEVLRAYKDVHDRGMLHTLTFVTVNDYLWLLRAVSKELAAMGREGLYYLAAAVSDFFLPSQKMSEHKIQSGKGSLQIEMDQVPKILKPMVDEWTPDGYVVSFKLETDPALLIPKAQGALERYGHQVVIGNDLNRRKFEVVFITRRPEGQTTQPDKPFDETWLRIDQDAALHHNKEIEENIVAELVRRHGEWIQGKRA